MVRIVVTIALLLALASPAWAATADEDLAASLQRSVVAMPGDAVRRSASPCRPCAPAVHPCFQKKNRWRFGIAPYGWLASVDGTAYSNGNGTDFEVSFEDILKRANGGFQLYTEARYNRFYFSFDGTWATLGDNLDLAPLRLVTRSLDVEVEQQILDFRVGYRVWRKMLSTTPAHCGSKPCRSLDVYLYAGVRYFRTKLTVDLDLPVLGRQRVTDTSEYFDPLLGARITMDLGKRWSVALHGDAAALFSSDDIMSWQTQVMFSYAFSRHVALAFGYRWMGLDQTTGTGADRNGAKMINHGPVIGLGFAF